MEWTEPKKKLYTNKSLFSHSHKNVCLKFEKFSFLMKGFLSYYTHSTLNKTCLKVVLFCSSQWHIVQIVYMNDVYLKNIVCVYLKILND